MKRKLLILALVAAMACSLAACSLTEAESLSFVSQPQSVFVVGDDVDINSLVEVNAVLTNGAVRNDVPVKITNFSTEKAGVYTATVTYRGVSISFTYYVMNSLDANFIAGTGTAEDPYLIANADQLANIGKETGAYKYFKVADGIQEIDCTGYATTAVNGAFDGNGVAFTNLAVTLFTAEGFDKVELQNFSVKECEIVASTSYDAVILDDAAKDTVLKNINISGGSLQAIVAASFISFGVGYGEQDAYWNVTMENCISSVALIGTEACAGFVGHMFVRIGGEPSWTWNLTESYYTGTMYNSNESKCYYLTYLNYHQGNLVLDYETLPEELSGAYQNHATNEAKPYTTSGVSERKYQGTITLLSKETESLPENIHIKDQFVITAKTGAVRADVQFVVGPNGKLGEDGKPLGTNYTGVYMTETLTPVNGQFTTEDIRYRNVTVNGAATTATGVSEDGTTFNIVNTAYSGTYGSCYVQIIQYDKYDNILLVTNIDWLSTND